MCDLNNEDDISVIRIADENFPYYIMKTTTCVVQLRKSHVDKWGSEFSAGNQILFVNVKASFYLLLIISTCELTKVVVLNYSGKKEETSKSLANKCKKLQRNEK